MNSLSFTSYRLVRKLSSPRISQFSWCSYRELNNNSSKLHATSAFDKIPKEDVLWKRFVTVDAKNSPDKKQLGLQFQNIVSQTKDIFRTVKLSDLKAAPQPAFWYGVGGLIPFAFPPLSFMLFGYSPFLAAAHLTYGATICAFLGGVKWGYTVDEKSPQQPTWENLGYAVTPQLVAWLGLLLPQTLGFILVSGGLAGAAFVDLTTGTYPPWFKALRLALTVPAVLFLLLSALMSLFH